MTETGNSIVETIRVLKQFSQGLVEVVQELSAPIPAIPHIITFCDIKIDQATGRCWYKGKEFRLRKGGLTYILLNLLVVRVGHPVLHKEIVDAVKEVKGVETIITKETISSCIRELRRKFGINTDINPQDDIFLATGTGFRLIPR